CRHLYCSPFSAMAADSSVTPAEVPQITLLPHRTFVPQRMFEPMTAEVPQMTFVPQRTFEPQTAVVPQRMFVPHKTFVRHRVPQITLLEVIMTSDPRPSGAAAGETAGAPATSEEARAALTSR